MKSALLTKPMAVRNNSAMVNDPFRRAPRCQARRNHPKQQPVMPCDQQIRYPVLFAVLLTLIAMATLNFMMQM